MGSDLRIVFMGTPAFAVSSLEALVQNKMNIVGVVTVPDRQAGRGQTIQQSEVKKCALKYNLKLFQPLKLKDADFLSDLKSLNPDLIVVVAFRMLPELVWKMPRLGTINLHASLLPDYRGAAPINWSIINGETETGLTTFFIDREIDTGKILLQKKININPDETAGDLHDKMMDMGAALLLETVYKISSGNYIATEQKILIKENKKIKLAPKISKEDCRIDWNKGSTYIYNFIRGLSPYPGAFTELISPDQKKYLIKIYKSSVLPKQSKDENGTIFTDQKTFLNVASTGGLVSLQELQLTGRKKMGIHEFLRGFPIKGTWRV